MSHFYTAHIALMFQWLLSFSFSVYLIGRSQLVMLASSSSSLLNTNCSVYVNNIATNIKSSIRFLLMSPFYCILQNVHPLCKMFYPLNSNC